MIKKTTLILLVLNSLILFNPKMASAGTSKSLSWCSYLDINNDDGGNFKKIKCINTSGEAMSYCFNFILFKNGSVRGGDCNVWKPLDNISASDINLLNSAFAKWNNASNGTTPFILKHKSKGDIILIHYNETSPELEYCDKTSHSVAGVTEPGDICWLGKTARKLSEPF